MVSKKLQWLRIAFFNLLLVAFIGLVLRYKIAFSLPFIDQKHLLHAHSHFAFSGWVTQLLMTLLVASLGKQKGKDQFKRYKWMLYANLFTAYGMLIFFAFQGYGFSSILFSTLSIIVSWIFAVIYWKDLNRLLVKKISTNWYKAALLMNAVSALGAFALAFMMANKIIHQNWYLLSVYFFLHFQYNGWFFFACMGLLLERIGELLPKGPHMEKVFWFFAAACIPAYFLSALWLDLPGWFYMVIVLSALVQLVAWYMLVRYMVSIRSFLNAGLSVTAKWLMGLSAIALSIKLFLQLFSTLPALSELAFGFRPIVIGYLHLILLGVISLFLIGYTVAEKLLPSGKLVLNGIAIFTVGVIVNEVFLMIQGLTALTYHIVPYMNELLIFTALLLFTGMALLNLGIIKQK